MLMLPAAVLLAPPDRAAAQDVAVENTPLSVSLGGQSVALEALIARPVDAQDKLPILLIVPGLPTATRTSFSASVVTPIARDLARRGWLAAVVLRRGYGSSQGPKPSPLSCDVAQFRQKLAADADDLQAAQAALAQRPDADPQRVIALGNATGGAAVVALSARNPSGLKAAVSISGGLQSEMKCAWDQALVEVFSDFGAKSRVPNLWMYAKNDTVFNPDVTDRMHAAFLDGGGDVTFMLFDAVGSEGQTLFMAGGSRYLWMRELDAFLRARQLPTWSRTDLDRVMTKLNYKNDLHNASALRILELYFAGPGEKALAHSSTKDFVNGRATLFGAMTRASLDMAKTAALEACNKQTADCAIIMENGIWVGDAR